MHQFPDTGRLVQVLHVEAAYADLQRVSQEDIHQRADHPGQERDHHGKEDHRSDDRKQDRHDRRHPGTVHIRVLQGFLHPLRSLGRTDDTVLQLFSDLLELIEQSFASSQHSGSRCGRLCSVITVMIRDAPPCRGTSRGCTGDHQRTDQSDQDRLPVVGHHGSSTLFLYFFSRPHNISPLLIKDFYGFFIGTSPQLSAPFPLMNPS